MPTDWLLEEYKIVWGFYIRTIESREKVIDFYFKSIAIPAGLLIVFATLLRFGFFGEASDDGETSLDSGTFAIGLGLLLIVIFLTGLGTFFYYSKETQVSIGYRKYLGEIIRKAKEIDRNIGSITSNPMSDGVTQKQYVFGRATFLRISPIVCINSAIGSLAFFILVLDASDFRSLVLSIFAFCGLLLAHGLIFYIHNKSGDEKPQPQIDKA